MKHIVLIVMAIVAVNCMKKEEIQSSTAVERITLPQTFEEKLSSAALSIIDPMVVYDPSYVSIKYPNGDVPATKGVCTDVIIRTYRKLTIDLQKWGMKTTDTNIDHRRVPNLETFFERKGQKLAVTTNPSDYKTGEIVSWMINGKLPHIGIITSKKSADRKRNLIVHNIGGGQVLSDCLFDYEIVGHFKYKK